MTSQQHNGWEETAKLFKPVEYFYPESYEELVSVLLRGFQIEPAFLNRHEVPQVNEESAGDELAGHWEELTDAGRVVVLMSLLEKIVSAYPQRALMDPHVRKAAKLLEALK